MKTTFEQAHADGVEAVGTWLQTKRNKLTCEQAKMLGEFMGGLPYMELMSCWNSLQHNTKNLRLVHPFVERAIVKAATTPGESPADTRVERQYVHSADGQILNMKIAKDAIAAFDAKFERDGYVVKASFVGEKE